MIQQRPVFIGLNLERTWVLTVPAVRIVKDPGFGTASAIKSAMAERWRKSFRSPNLQWKEVHPAITNMALLEWLPVARSLAKVDHVQLMTPSELRETSVKVMSLALVTSSVASINARIPSRLTSYHQIAIGNVILITIPKWNSCMDARTAPDFVGIILREEKQKARTVRAKTSVDPLATGVATNPDIPSSNISPTRRPVFITLQRASSSASTVDAHQLIALASGR